MELEDLKKNWESTINKANSQDSLTSNDIDLMIQKKFKSKIRKIRYPEMMGGIICVLALIFIWFNFNKLDTFFLQATGILAMLLLFILPVFSFLSLSRFSSADNFNNTYIENVKLFANQKIRFLQYQNANAFLNYLLLISILIILPKYFYGKDITFIKSFWIFAFSFGYLFLLYFSKWVKKHYNHSLKEAEELLKETAP